MKIPKILKKPIFISKLSKRQQISLASLLIILISLPLAIFLTQQRQIYRGRAVGDEARPTNVKIANLHGGGFSISWTSSDKNNDEQFITTTGWVQYGTAANNLNQTAYDDRGGENFSSTTHHVSIFNLQAETTYSFKIKSGPYLYSLDAGGDRWVRGGAAKEQKTPRTLELTGNPRPIYGFIKNQAGNKVGGALVYVRFKKDDSDTKSALMSTVTKSNEGWVMDAKNARRTGLGNFFDFDNNDRVLIDVQAVREGIASADFALNNSSPAPDITLTVMITPTPTPTPVSPNCVSFKSIRINNCTKDKWEQGPRHLDCYTTNPAVTINLNSPRATQMRFGVPPSFDVLCSDLDESYWYRWENYAPVAGWNAWRHSPGVGDKKICVQFGNAAGLSQKCSGAITIVIDSLTPTPTPTPTATPTPAPTPTPTPTPCSYKVCQGMACVTKEKNPPCPPDTCSTDTECVCSYKVCEGTSCVSKTQAPPCPPDVCSTDTECATPQANLTFKIKFQGIAQQKPDKTVRVILKQGDQEKYSSDPLGVSSDQNGVYSGNITGIEPGTYDIYIKGWAHLQKKFADITLAEGENSQDFSETSLIVGDINGDNTINAVDIGIVIDDYWPDTPAGSPADLNLDGRVNAIDIGLLIENYFLQGD